VFIRLRANQVVFREATPAGYIVPAFRDLANHQEQLPALQVVHTLVQRLAELHPYIAAGVENRSRRAVRGGRALAKSDDISSVRRGRLEESSRPRAGPRPLQLPYCSPLPPRFHEMRRLPQARAPGDCEPRALACILWDRANTDPSGYHLARSSDRLRERIPGVL
jgi:hypothetical protein